MDQNRALSHLQKALEKVVLTEDQKLDRDREEFIAQVNRQEREQKLTDLRIPKHLRPHIPRQPGKFLRLQDEARKAQRAHFSLHKAFPEPLKFLHQHRRNQALSNAIKTLGQRIQTNGKHSLAGTVEINSDLHHVLTDFKQLIIRHQSIPSLFNQEHANLNPDLAKYLSSSISAELSKYHQIFADLNKIYTKLQALSLLQGDTVADGIEQVTHICLALKNLRPPKTDVKPTSEEFRSARGRNQFSRPWRGRRGSGRGRYNRYTRGRGGYQGYQGGYSNQHYQNHQYGSSNRFQGNSYNNNNNRN